MQINTKSMLFEELTLNEAITLEKELEDIVFHGKIDWNSKFLNQWVDKFGYNDQKLLVVSTVYVSRALFSILKMRKHYEY